MPPLEDEGAAPQFLGTASGRSETFLTPDGEAAAEVVCFFLT